MFRSTSVAIVAMILLSSLAHAADPATSCQSGKLKVAGKYASCRLSADAKAVKTGDTVDYDKCTEYFVSKWVAAEVKGADMCPNGDMDAAPISSFIDACDTAVATALAGSPLPLDVLACNDDLATCTTDLDTCTANSGSCAGDLATCEADLAACEAVPLAQPLSTGQTTCYEYPTGDPTPCAGTGQDGELQLGIARNFVDNGDGTITDMSTGLMWEVQTDDGGIHDKDTDYTWGAAFTTKIATLNAGSFAGYNDWRLPNHRELSTLVRLDVFGPAAYLEFNTACAPGCTLGTCSCTDNDWYWSSSTYMGNVPFKWATNFNSGDTEALGQGGNPSHVRAVRSAL